jgi:pimeloyl-ACP methyl ester carboxylesterase
MEDGTHNTIVPPGYDKITSSKLNIDGHHVHYLKTGTGPSIILLHGGASDSRDWIDTMNALSNFYSLYAPDILGYGMSAKPKSSYYMFEFVESTLGFIRKLGSNSYPEMIHRLVLIDTVGFGRLARWGMYMGAFMYWLRKALGKTQPYPRFLKEDGEDRDWRCIDKLSALKVPTLVIWNQRDPYYPVSQALRAEQLIPDVRLEIFPGYGHAPHMQRRGYFNNILNDFITDNG